MSKIKKLTYLYVCVDFLNLIQNPKFRYPLIDIVLFSIIGLNGVMTGTPPQAQAIAAAASEKNLMTTEETKKKMLLLVLSCAMLALGNCGGPLLTRLYFLRGGSRIWLSSFLVTAGWPLILLFLYLPLPHIIIKQVRAPHQATPAPGMMKLPLFTASAGIGILTGLDDYLYASGVARLPVSTSALILAAHLAFTAGFAFLLVRHRFTPYSINAVVLLTIGAAVLGLRADGDRPAGESKGEYYTWFFMTPAGSALYGFVLPAVELAYSKARKRGGATTSLSWRVVMETQMVISLFASGFCVVGMVVNHDFEVGIASLSL